MKYIKGSKKKDKPYVSLLAVESTCLNRLVVMEFESTAVQWRLQRSVSALCHECQWRSSILPDWCLPSHDFTIFRVNIPVTMTCVLLLLNKTILDLQSLANRGTAFMQSFYTLDCKCHGSEECLSWFYIVFLEIGQLLAHRRYLINVLWNHWIPQHCFWRNHLRLASPERGSC